MLLLSELDEVSRRFPVHVEEARRFLLHEGFPVEAPDAVAVLSARLRDDLRFRHDLSSLVRTAVYRERGEASYMDLLGILVVAAAGSRDDLESDSQEAPVRDILRFVMQARRSLTHAGEEEEMAPPRTEHFEAASVATPSVPMRRERPLTEARPSAFEPGIESVRRDQPLWPFREDDWLAPPPAPEAPWWREHAVGAVGILGVLLGLSAGLMIRQSGSPANSHVASVTMTASSGHTGATGSSAPTIARRSGSSFALSKPSPATVRGPRQPAGTLEVARSRRANSSNYRRAASERPLVTNSAGSGLQPTPAPIERRVTDPAVLSAEFAHTAGPPASTGAAASKPVVMASAGRAAETATLSGARGPVVRPGSAGIMAGNVIFSPAPQYPPEASAAGVQGAVTVRAVVDRDGSVSDARVVSGPPLLRDAALEAVQRWRYRPFVQDGKPIAVATTAIVDFQMPH